MLFIATINLRILAYLFVSFDSLRSIRQVVSYVRTVLRGLNQY